MAVWFTESIFSKRTVLAACRLRSRFDGRYFPDISQGKVVACVKVTDFDMTFPVATIRFLQ